MLSAKTPAHQMASTSLRHRNFSCRFQCIHSSFPIFVYFRMTDLFGILGQETVFVICEFPRDAQYVYEHIAVKQIM